MDRFGEQGHREFRIYAEEFARAFSKETGVIILGSCMRARAFPIGAIWNGAWFSKIDPCFCAWVYFFILMTDASPGAQAEMSAASICFLVMIACLCAVKDTMEMHPPPSLFLLSLSLSLSLSLYLSLDSA